MAKRPAREPPRPAKSPVDTRRILAELAAQHPNANTELTFSNAYELLVATILSAQCTDERVNQVTPALFKRYPTPRALAAATTGDLEPQIQSTGFFRAKSRALVGMAAAIASDYGGQVPATMDELVTLPGVGRKTANVVLGHALGVPGLPVDRHVLRVSNRIGIARSEDPEVVEQQLCGALPAGQWTTASDTLILHGRRICKPKPLCDRCAVREDCDYYRTVIARAGRPPRGPTTQKRRGAKPRGTGRRDEAPVERAESGSLVDERRSAKRRGTSRGGRAPVERAESGSLVDERRAARRRGTRRGGNGAPQDRAESGSLVDERRAARRRGTGRGGGAPRQTKK